MSARILSAAMFMVLAMPASATIYTVGAAGGGCTHLSIQAAVNAATGTTGADEIRVARTANYTAQAVQITTNEELALVGGYANCSSTQPDATRTVVSGDGGAAAPVFQIRGNGAVTLRNFTIRDGDHVNGRGGGIDWRSGGSLDVDHVTLIDNDAGYGGAVYAQGSNLASEVRFGDGVLVTENRAQFDGGGLYVAAVEFVFDGTGSSIYLNEARGDAADTGYGGGAFVAGLTEGGGYLYLGATGVGGLGVVYANRAVHGGGVAVRGGEETGTRAHLRVWSRQEGVPARIHQNIASARGGAIYIGPDGDDTAGNAPAQATLWFTELTDNEAPLGGAVFLDKDDYSLFDIMGISGRIYINPQPDFPYSDGDEAVPVPGSFVGCPVDAPCGAISRNIASDPAGAIVQCPGDNGLCDFIARRILIQDNRAADLVDMGDNDFSNVTLFNTVVTGNTVTRALFRHTADREYAHQRMRHVTIADNAIGGATLFHHRSGTELVNTLIAQPGKTILPAGAQPVLVRYVVAHETASLGDGIRSVAPPRFLDPARGDYRLRAGSRGVDYANYDAQYPDSSKESVDGDIHGLDLPIAGVEDASRRTDVGAYERQSLKPLVLNGDFDADFNLWAVGGATWDGTQDIDGVAGSGSARVPMTMVIEGAHAKIAGGVSQCVHLPGPGTYRLNGFARILPSSNPPQVSSRASLSWTVHYNGSSAGCGGGAPDQSGLHPLATTATWTRPASPAYISISPAAWTPDTSLTIVTDVQGALSNPPTAWFDGIELDIGTPPPGFERFADGFEN